MRIGLVVNGSGGLSFEDWIYALKTAEKYEFPSLFVSDHFVVGEAQASLEPYLLFALAARESTSLRFGPLVTPITFRAPWNLGRWAAQLDILSGGRFVLGLGVGWHEPEHAAFGIPYPPLRERFDRLDEGIRVMKGMWASEPATFEGRYYKLSGAEALPKPGAGRPPIMIGGGGEKRSLLLAAKYADEWNGSNLQPDGFRHKLEVLARHCETVGRDPSAITHSMLSLAAIGPSQSDIDHSAKRLKDALAPDLDISVADYREQLRSQGTLVGGADEVVQALGALAEAGLEEVIFSHPDPASDTFPAFLASEVASKVAAL